MLITVDRSRAYISASSNRPCVSTIFQTRQRKREFCVLFSLVTDLACALGSPFSVFSGPQVQARARSRERDCVEAFFAPFFLHRSASSSLLCSVCAFCSVILEAEERERKTHMLRMFLSFIHWLLLSLAHSLTLSYFPFSFTQTLYPF